MQTYPRTIAAPGTHEIVVKKSRFLCTLARAMSEDDARAAIEWVRRHHWDANHNCSAYRVGPGGHLQRTSDDGEPAGTAGAPILGALTRRDLTDTVAVVTRYFGGVLLGTGGLVRAYGQAVSAAIDAVGVVELRPVALIAVDADHADAGRLEHALRGAGFALGPVTHADRVTFEVRLDKPDLSVFEAWLAEASNGRSRVRVIGHTHVEVEVPAKN
ncbi:MAG: YigZ family protein [Chloroflexota bacterium]|nr:YigZ family protein [Chloroflexota bacterium]